MKKIFTLALALVGVATALAGGLSTNTNQNIAFLRNPARGYIVGYWWCIQDSLEFEAQRCLYGYFLRQAHSNVGPRCLWPCCDQQLLAYQPRIRRRFGLEFWRAQG